MILTAAEHSNYIDVFHRVVNILWKSLLDGCQSKHVLWSLFGGKISLSIPLFKNLGLQLPMFSKIATKHLLVVMWALTLFCEILKRMLPLATLQLHAAQMGPRSVYLMWRKKTMLSTLLKDGDSESFEISEETTVDLNPLWYVRCSIFVVYKFVSVYVIFGVISCLRILFAQAFQFMVDSCSLHTISY